MDAPENATTLSPSNGALTGPPLDEILDAIARAHTESLDAEETVAALRHAREEIETLKEALRTRTVIGQAIGLLMCEATITADAAFARLVDASSHTNVKLREIAERMVAQANERGSGPQKP